MADRDNALGTLVERPRPTILAATAVALIATAGLWIASLLAARLSLQDRVGREFLFDALYYLPFVALPVALYAIKRPGLSASMRLNPMPPLTTLAVILAAMLSVYLASALDAAWAMLLNTIGLHEPEVSVEIGSSRGLMLAILHSAAIPAIFEELLCRGFVLAAFESRGTRLAVWVSSVIFALMHGNVYGLPAYLLVGATSAFLVFALDSLYAGIAYHTVYNTLILLSLYLLPAAESDAANSAPGAALAASVAVDVALAALMMLLLLRTLDRRRRALGIKAVSRIREPLRTGERALLIALGIVFAATCTLVLMGV